MECRLKHSRQRGRGGCRECYQAQTESLFQDVPGSVFVTSHLSQVFTSWLLCSVGWRPVLELGSARERVKLTGFDAWWWALGDWLQKETLAYATLAPPRSSAALTEQFVLLHGCQAASGGLINKWSEKKLSSISVGTSLVRLFRLLLTFPSADPNNMLLKSLKLSC